MSLLPRKEFWTVVCTFLVLFLLQIVNEKEHVGRFERVTAQTKVIAARAYFVGCIRSLAIPTERHATQAELEACREQAAGFADSAFTWGVK